MAAEPMLPALIQNRASPEQRRALQACVEVAASLRTPIYLVGGAVRDLLLTGKLPKPDLDIVIEGDAIKFAEKLAEKLDRDVRTHPRFLTAEVSLGDSHLDFVTARSERYAEPASLPNVAAADLATDLARRDFTVNSIALALWPDVSGELIDPFGGQLDLEQQILRVLYETSFFDDPTRILRGVRVGCRLRLELDPQTAALARSAIAAGAFQPLSAHRLRQELILVLEDAGVGCSIHELQDLGFLAVLGRQTPLRDSEWQWLERVIALRSDGSLGDTTAMSIRWWLIYLMVIFLSEGEEAQSTLTRILGLDDDGSSLLASYVASHSRSAMALEVPALAPSDVYRIVEDLHPEEWVLLLTCQRDAVADQTALWFNELREIRLTISGKDLKDSGFPESPVLGQALEATLVARLDGRIGQADELEYAKQFLTTKSG